MRSYKICDQESLYFLTLTVVGWVDVFTRKAYRDIVISSFKHCQKERGLVIYSYVIMSNHIHLIVRADKGKKLSNILRDFKKFTANTILRAIKNERESRKDWMLMVFTYHAKLNTNNRYHQFWIQDNHPIELISPKWILQKLDYIHQNPVKAAWVGEAEDYLYSSASNYATGKGLLEVEIIDLGSTVGYVYLG